MKIGLIAGSFDPITFGHIELIKRGLDLVDKLHIVAAVNPNKKHMFDAEERVALIETVLSRHLSVKDRVKVSVDSIQNKFLMWYADERQVSLNIRGIRNATDFAYEYEQQLLNERINHVYGINKDLRTVYITPPAHLTAVSSSTVRSMVGIMGWHNIAKEFVDSVVLKAMDDKNGNQ